MYISVLDERWYSQEFTGVAEFTGVTEFTGVAKFTGVAEFTGGVEGDSIPRLSPGSNSTK